MTTETTVSNLIINTMTAAQYATITPSSTELYMITDEAITSSDVTTALGYTPENHANLVTTISSLSTNTTYPSAKAVYDALQAGGSGNAVTIDTDQNITGVKTFVGDKKVAFKQSTSSNKLGFTLYNYNNVEKGYLEFAPNNMVDSVPLMTLGNYATVTEGLTHVGFRKYSSISGANGAYNLLTPLISKAKTPFNLGSGYKNFYFPLGFKNGSITALTSDTGLADLGSLFADYQTTANLVTTLNSTSTDTTYPSAKAVYSAIQAGGGGGASITVDDTLSTTSTNPVQNKVITSAIPTSTTQLTNDSGYITGITSSDVTSALGYTPYNSNNPSGYQANVIETVKVNGTALTPSSKAVNITVPTNTTQLVNGSGFITSSALSGYQTTANLVTSVTSTSTDSTYPSAKCLYDALQNVTTYAMVVTDYTT